MPDTSLEKYDHVPVTKEDRELSVFHIEQDYKVANHVSSIQSTGPSLSLST